MTYPFRNLVFEGGGVKGIAYVGALRVLQELNILQQIERLAGTSAGAINAVLLALGYSPEETGEILAALNFKKFMDDSWGMVRDGSRLLTEFGWYKGDFFRAWMGQMIAAKAGHADATFAELKKKGCRVRIPTESGHPFRRNPATHSDGIRPPVPMEFGYP